MLVLTRKLGEEIVIGDDIQITVLKLDSHQVRIGISAPRSVSVDRAEVRSRRHLPMPVRQPTPLELAVLVPSGEF